MLEALQRTGAEKVKRIEEEDEAVIKSIFGVSVHILLSQMLVLHVTFNFAKLLKYLLFHINAETERSC